MKWINKTIGNSFKEVNWKNEEHIELVRKELLKQKGKDLIKFLPYKEKQRAINKLNNELNN